MIRFLFFLLTFLLAGCNTQVKRLPGDAKGISPEYLDLISEGPRGTSLIYFQKDIIKKNGIKACRIYEQSPESETRISKQVYFDLDGNLVREVNNFFPDWENGTYRGTYVYLYDDNKRLREYKGIDAEDSEDSVRIVLNYLPSGQILSRDVYEFSRKLKPGADRHLPMPDDFETVPRWSLSHSVKFWCDSAWARVETVGGDYVNIEEYHLKFDSLNRIRSVQKIDDQCTETTSYAYRKNTIETTVFREVANEYKSVFYVRTTLDTSGNIIERITRKSSGDISSTVVLTYDPHGTLSEIRRDDKVKRLEYLKY